MTRIWLVVVAIVGCSAPAKAPAPTVLPLGAAGELAGDGSVIDNSKPFDPPAPTLRLPRHFTPTKYVARLAIDPASPAFDGEIAIDGTLDRRSAAIWLDGKHLDVTRATASNGGAKVALAVTAKGDYLQLRPAQALDPGHWTLELAYRGTIEQNGFEGAYRTKQGDDAYVVTQFESTAARLVFPCFDEPDRKTPWQLTLDIPKGLVAVSNTPATSTTSADATHDRIAFAPTRPLPSYLVAFAIGPWELVDAGKAKSGVPIRVVTPRGTAKKAAFLASAEPRIVDILESWFAIPFPYPKLDIVVVPSLRGGAMENAGMITTDSRITMFDHPSAHDRFTVVSVIGHETAHQWFGDLVTAAWWDDIWLNESFATWIENKILVAFGPTWPSEFLSWRGVFASDELGSARKIRQPIESEGDIHNAFDSITYPKGGLVLRMLEHQLGEAKFQGAIRSYLAAHADGNATAADVFHALEVANGASLAPITSSFFDQPGLPEVAMTLACTGDHATVTLAQHRFMSAGAQLPAEQWAVPVCIAYEGAKHERVETCTVLAKPTAEIALDRCPAWFAPASVYGYYRAKVDAKAIEAIRDRAWTVLTSDERVVIFADIWSQVRTGQIGIPLAMTVLDKLRAGPPNELAAGLGDASTLGYGGTGLPYGIDGWIALDQRPAVRARVRTVIEPLARKLGLVAHADENFAAETVRVDVLSAARWSRTHVLDAEAKRLAAHYRDLPTTSRATVLEIAANADPAVAERLRLEALDEHDPELRDLLLRVVAGLDDPKRHHAMLDKLVPDPKITAEDLAMILGSGDVDAQLDSEAYIRAHFDDLARRLPTAENEDFPIILRLAYVFGATCDASRRDDVVAFLNAHFSAVPTAARPIKQLIEGLDHCIARRQLLEPSVRAWLGVKGSR